MRKTFSHFSEFYQGIVGRNVWYFLLEKKFSERDVKRFVENIPQAEELFRLREQFSTSPDDLVGYVPTEIVGEVNSINFWKKFGIKFHHNADTAKFDWDQYSGQKICKEGIYVGSPLGIAEGESASKQKKRMSRGYSVTSPGVQITFEAVTLLMSGSFINKNHIVRCDCTTLGLVAVGGGDSSTKVLRVYKDTGLSNKKATLSCFKKVEL